MTGPRVAFFTDSFLEVNGVARTSREFAPFAHKHHRPLFSVHTGPHTVARTEGSLQTYELKHSRFVIPLETDLAFDLLFLRHLPRLSRALKAFRPDLLHVTGPGHIGLLGAILARHLNVPLAASWHTNVHEFGAKRLRKILRFLPERARSMAANFAEAVTLNAMCRFYKRGQLLFAPNPELVEMLRTQTHRPTYLMQRGIDTDLFSPSRRTRITGEFVIGYVGRLSPEKNVRLLVAIERELVARGIRNCRFVVIGDGGNRDWLAANLQNSEMPGVLLGEQLAAAYANMDIFLFPSETDTFGNVVLEAMSSGLPTLVTLSGGPKYVIRPGSEGFEADGPTAFADRLSELYRDPNLLQSMSRNARAGAHRYSWDAVFSGMYDRYSEILGRRQSESGEVNRPVSALSQA